ncbi:thiamine pyrophosphate-dependent enzyme [Roseibacillus ishigakijimensis]|uniref:Thiamine pyrophosphate-dependent dehydrogenase E1 component subunit alpha n=2 Tax=Roseibacillus ishigakijimensis TaxID=454146 RepID=A0A934VKY2_9BACT|nr:thiamine pyrophosphate-dependent dehydrogenase E1 component subunit alpha [Roseibacillus ishigakijimensis]
MITARILEDKLRSLYKAGQIVGGVYLGRGQEALSGVLGTQLQPGRDVFAPLIRDQAGRTGFGEELLDVTRTYLGSVEGPMRGRDGNIHRGRPEKGMPAMISHLGAAVSVVTGMLLARRLKGELAGVVGATCIGDGGTSTGAFHEGLNLAAVEQLPLVVIVANNQYAYSTPNHRQFVGDLFDRAAGYGVRGWRARGNSLLDCLAQVGGAVAAARGGEGPQLVVADLLRLGGHGEHDDGAYVDAALKAGELGRDCLAVAREELLQKGGASESEWAAWEEEAREEVTAAVAQTQRESTPDARQEDWRALKDLAPEGIF